MAKRKLVWQAAVEVLRETENSGVMWGDECVLHLIATKMGWKHEAWKTSTRVLNALSKTPGVFKKSYVQLPNGRVVRNFNAP